ncbi:hypothetical protein [Nocardia bovistercoris]|uniref:Uncharacterized protein n=1 Tax=Nocardia bovistercoris TaxID=2785916 RepID=A0A931II04_9NOCA|nr:hypothetical protein [Nocardia bovistercoris]MBH0780377.1 hypothetical protein [Nocardia bovistercoris]
MSRGIGTVNVDRLIEIEDLLYDNALTHTDLIDRLGHAGLTEVARVIEGLRGDPLDDPSWDE